MPVKRAVYAMRRKDKKLLIFPDEVKISEDKLTPSSPNEIDSLQNGNNSNWHHKSEIGITNSGLASQLVILA